MSGRDHFSAIECGDEMGQGMDTDGIQGRDQGRCRVGFIVNGKDSRRGKGGPGPSAGAGTVPRAGTWVKKRARNKDGNKDKGSDRGGVRDKDI